MATKSTKKSVSGSTTSAKSKALAKGRKVAKVSVVKKTPAKARVVKISSVKASPAKAAKSNKAKAQMPKATTNKKAKAQTPKAAISKKTKAEAPKRPSHEKTKAEIPKKRPTTPRKGALKKILLAKRKALVQQIQAKLGQSLTDEQQRRLEAAMDSGDQALVDL
ncbi:MAG: hypothetical protein VST68_05175, partial [Nitrospirota bacterium]|nr:hypothetical protein [Nitrospirota bacterium]